MRIDRTSVRARLATLPPVPCPKGMAFHPFQLEGIHFAAERFGALIGDEMGTGKTVQAAGVINLTRPASVLVLCPAAVRIHWYRTLRRWLVPRGQYIAHVTDDAYAVHRSSNLVVANYARIVRSERVWRSLRRAWDLVICDEAQLLKNNKSKRHKRTLGRGGLTDGCGRLLMLSGTPFMNRPAELFHLVHRLAPSAFPSWWKFIHRYCGAYRNQWGLQYDGAENLTELNRRLRRTCMIRRMKAEVAPDLPPKTRQVLVMPVEDKATRQLLADEWSVFETHRQALRKMRGMGKLPGPVATVRRQVAMEKAKAAMTYLRRVAEEKDKLVVWAYHQDVVDYLAERLGAVKYRGGMSSGEQEHAVDSFQHGPARVFVGGLAAAGIGIELTAADTAIFLEMDWTPAMMTQAEDRLHRMTTTRPVLIQHLILENSLDERIVRMMVGKQEWAEKALGEPPELDIHRVKRGGTE